MCPKRLRTHQEIKSIADVIKTLTERVDESSTFSICVTREQMVERGIKQWHRQKKSSPKNALRVTFIGEAGIDNGALKTEFLTEMMSGIEERFFEGGDGGKTPKYSITDLDKHNFKVIGEIFAASIAQGGPPPNFFSQWCYKYISTGEVDQEAITERDITDPEVMELIKEIKAADNTTVMEFTDRILSCGYTVAVSFEKKEEIVRYMTFYCRLLVF
ncbi:G2/M phase-specific E3 ubiquitin-protein ligase-like [Pseudorasbora parva]|uniref:G2/M phase-specific E3 ubiquitin-protein ligase-like n=1 Tax=Pseudorasbora parva TaxID=51549 RepID=UPI00351EB534